MASKEDKKRLWQERKEAINFLNSYIRSPGFNERFNKTNLAKRLKLKKGNLGYAPNLKFEDRTYNAVYDDKNNIIFYDPNIDMVLDNSSITNDPYEFYKLSEGTSHANVPKGNTMAHEFGHFADEILSNPNNYDLINNYDSNTIGVYSGQYYNQLESKNAINEHDKSFWENYADIFALRKWLLDNKIYDSTKANNPFTQEHLNKAKEIGKGYFIRPFNNFTDEELINIMNTVAQDNTKRRSLENDINYV